MCLEKNIKKVAEDRKLSFCYKKVAEELFELGEIVMKQLNKPDGAEDRIKPLSEEMGDVILNIKLLASKLDIEQQVQKRVEDKLKTLMYLQR